MIKGDKMLTHNFKIINDPSQWDGDMKNFFNSLAEYWLSIHPKPNRRWREEYAMKLYKQLNGDFIEILARWKIYFSNYCIECGRIGRGFEILSMVRDGQVNGFCSG